MADSACAECGNVARFQYGYRTASGAAPRLLPICARCRELKQLRMIGWVVGLVVVSTAVVAGLGLAMDQLVPADVQRRFVAPFVIVAFAAGVVPLWLGLRDGRRMFHRRFSVVRFDGATTDAGPYRTAEPPPETRRAQPASATLLVLLGLLMIGGGIFRYLEIGSAERHGKTFSLRSLEILLYHLAGRGGVLALYLLVGVPVLWLAIRQLRRALSNDA
jgi:hypothetical protein